MRTHRIAAIGGHGTGPCILAAGLQVLAVCAERDGQFRLDVEPFDWRSDAGSAPRAAMPAEDLEPLRAFDAIFVAAAGVPGTGDHIAVARLKQAIRRDFDQYVSVQPIRMLHGVLSPLRNVTGPELDWLIIGENLDGERCGLGQRALAASGDEAATDIAVLTRADVARVMRHAFQTARQRPRKLLTVVTPAEAPDEGSVIWSEIAADMAQGYPDIVWNETPVDVMTMRMTLEPRTLDTIVASGPHADILASLASALAGSPGIAASANLNPERRAPSMFGPLHGSALGRQVDGTANPIAAFWAGAMMLNHLGEKDAAAMLMRAVERVTADPALHTPDLGGHSTMEQSTLAVCAALCRDEG